MIRIDSNTRILLVALSGAGDILMASPFIDQLRKYCPGSQIDILVQNENLGIDLLQYNHNISNILHFQFIQEGLIKSLNYCYKLRTRSYDVSINIYPQARYHYSVISYIVGAKLRIGFNYDSQTTKLNRLFFHYLIDENRKLHVVENNLKVLSYLDIPHPVSPVIKLYSPKFSDSFAINYLAKNKIREFVVIHPGGGMMKNFRLKRWPAERFAKLVRRLTEELHFQIVIVGGDDEICLKNQIIAMSGLSPDQQIFDLSSNIQNTAAVIKRSRLVIANDSLIAHLAAAVGTYVITLFGPSDQNHTGPYTSKGSFICQRPPSIKPYQHGAKNMTPQQASWMSLISIEDVFTEVKKYSNL